MSKKLLLTAVLSGFMVSAVSLNAEGENPEPKNQKQTEQTKTSWMSTTAVTDLVKGLKKRDAGFALSGAFAVVALKAIYDKMFAEDEEDTREFEF